ncbi:MAG TPA: NB-ARC domain-containing protein [Phycisphaerae bacterium]|nr:NB-ARC domain-containing protein [Phycisphaerae bacterium]
MSDKLAPAIARIFDNDDNIVGMAFLVGAKHLLTCAHVVAKALNISADHRAKPDDPVRLDFPLIQHRQKLTARVACWSPFRNAGSGPVVPEEDVAMLVLDGDPPSKSAALPLRVADDLSDHKFRAVGCPPRHDGGVWANGKLLGPNDVGWVQIQALDGLGYFVQQGFSGTPVWDEKIRAVVGMVVAADTEAKVRVAYMIPVAALCKAWPDLADIQPQPVHSMGKPVNVPRLPDSFLPRPEYLQQVKDALLADVRQPVAVTGAARTAGLWGMGGIGKSVLAAAVARDPDVLRAFPDGVIWITLGQNPNLTIRQSQLATALGGSGGFEDVQQGRAYLSQLLADRGSLIVLDDVWQPAHVTPFDALGPHCRMLVTTRKQDVVKDIGAVPCEVELLDHDQATALFAGAVGGIKGKLPAQAREIIERCGNLPLALSMVGNMASKRPDRWDNILGKLRSANLARISQHLKDYEHPDLLAAMQISVDDLPADVRRRYLDFAVFPEDTAVPETVLRTLWESHGLNEYDTQDVLDVLVDRSLLRRDDRGRLTLHDLQRDYLRSEAGDFKPLHQRLVEAYGNRCKHNWPAGPNDGYYFQHICHHLARAGRGDELRKLLLDFEWIQAKLDATDPASLLADYDQLAGDSDLSAVQGALRLSAHVLAQDKGQLRSQLYGRLLGQESEDVKLLLLQMRQFATTDPNPWLRPTTPSLTPPGGPLLRTLTGHTASVWAVAVTPDGRQAVSGSFDNTLRVWDLETGRVVATFSADGAVTACAVVPDGLTIVAGDALGQVHILRLEQPDVEG